MRYHFLGIIVVFCFHGQVFSLCVFRISHLGKTIEFDLSMLEHFPYENVEFEIDKMKYVSYLSLCSPLNDLAWNYLGVESRIADVRALIFMKNDTSWIQFHKQGAEYFPLEKILSIRFESSTVCSSTGKNHLITLNLKFTKEHVVPEFESFNRSLCEFRFEWKTYLAKPVTLTPSCSHRLGDEVYNLNYLKHPDYHSVVSRVDHYDALINFCQLGSEERSSTRKFSFVWVALMEKSMNKSITLNSDWSSCHIKESSQALSCYLSHKSLKIDLLVSVDCDPNEFRIKPVMSSRKKKLVIEVRTFAICSQNIKCVATGKNLEYEVPKLDHVELSLNDSKIYLSSCGALRSYQKSSGILIRGDKEITSLGLIRELDLYHDNSVRVILTGGSYCGNRGERIQTEIKFVCSDRDSEKPRLVGRDECKYSFVWFHSAVCPFPFVKSKRCSVNDFTEDFSYNMTNSDGNNLFKIHQNERIFLVDLCGRTGVPCSASNDVSVCMKTGSEEFILGKRSTQELIFDKRFLTFEMTGENCRPHVVTRVYIEVSCDYGASNDSSPVITEINMEDCSFYFKWNTRRACFDEPKSTLQPPCRWNDSAGNEFDLHPLRRNSSNYRIKVNETHDIVLNVCGRLWHGKTEMCPMDSAVCLVTGKTFMSVGNLPGTFTNKNGKTVLLFLTTLLCESLPNVLVGSEITFRCSTGNEALEYHGYYKCNHLIVWYTKYACPNALKGNETSESIQKSEYSSIGTIVRTQAAKKMETQQPEVDYEKSFHTPRTINPSYFVSNFTSKLERMGNPNGKIQSVRISVESFDLDQWKSAINETSQLFTSTYNRLNVSGGICQDSFSCLVTSGSRNVNLGSRHGQPFHEGNSIRVDYFEGSVCDRTDRLRFSASYFYGCNESQESNEPIFLGYSNPKPCHFNFRWSTKWSCRSEAVTFHRANCTLMNRKTHELIDLKRIFQPGLKVNSGNSSVVALDLCTVNSHSGCSGISCTNDAYAAVPGFYDAILNTTTLSLKGSPFCEEKGINNSMELRLKCVRGGNDKSQNWTSRGSKCHVVLEFESPLLCFAESKKESHSIAWLVCSILVLVCLIFSAGFYFLKRRFSPRRLDSDRSESSLRLTLSREYLKKHG